MVIQIPNFEGNFTQSRIPSPLSSLFRWGFHLLSAVSQSVHQSALVWTFLFLSPCRRRHLSAAVTAAAGLFVAAVGLPGCCHVTPSPLCCLSPSSVSTPVSLLLSPSSPRPLCMCLVSCVLPRCHYRAVQITLFSNELSVCSPSALSHPPPFSCFPSSHPISPPAEELPVALARHLLCPTTRCPSQMLPIIPCTADT